MILLSTVLTISKMRRVKNSFWDSSRLRDWNKRVPTFPHLQVYIVLIIRQVDKQKGKLKLCQACPRASAFQNRMSTLQVPHTLCCFFFSSIWMKWAYKRWRAGIFLNYKKILDVNLHKKKIEPVFVKHYMYTPNICLPLNMATLHSALFPHKKLDFAEKLNR